MKTEIRKAALARRRALTIDERRTFSAQIAEKLFAAREYKNAEHIMCYASYNCEVETEKICERILADKKTLYLPRCISDNKMVCCRVDSLSELCRGRFGILEPTGEAVSPQILELVIVPLAAFDMNLGRIGYGGGFYDRFLPKTKAKRLALAFDVQKTHCAAFEDTDVLMDMIITEREMITGE